MPLIRIEVCDFKSYRGHQTIGPFRHFTSVIGPNGAGKSNLMDAISFVLGVKSAQLRSSQLKDLVYRGRRLAKDDAETGSAAGDVSEGEGEGEGTAKKAWVLAVYQDSSKKEWRFQRTVSTNGVSEYRLNDKVVTYSAYNAALMSQNILVKAKNFLVFQGDVEAVASQSPKELSRLIEQISGSLELQTEYDKAKEEQDRATENATFNFNKRRGIAGEIKQYMEQKSEAEKFEALCNERDDLILRRVLYKLYHIEDAIEQNVREINAQNRALDGLRQEQAARDQDLETARTAHAQVKAQVLQKEKAIKKAEKALDSKRPDLVTAEAQIKHSTRKRNNALKTKGEVAQSTADLQNKAEQLQAELEKVRKAAATAAEAQRKNSEHNTALSEESLEEYRKLKKAANMLAVDERQELESLKRNEKAASRSLGILLEKGEGLKTKRDSRATDLEGKTAKKKELEERLRDLREELDKVKQELDKQQSERTRIAQLEAQANEKLQTVYQQLLQAGQDKHESEKEIRLKETIESLQRIFPGVRGRVSDLCKPVARKYETAVSVVLGRNIDAIVVDEEKTAIDCIEYMRAQRAGQATFIPLDTIQVKPINDKFRSFAKGARLAVELIQFDASVERAMHHACGNALICDNMDIARHVCYEKGQEVKAVTLEGTIIHKSGLITGGKSTHNSNKKWDEKDLQGLIRTRDNLMAQLRDLSKQKPRGKTDDNLASDISRLESAIQMAKDELNAINLSLTGIKDELKHLEKEIKSNLPALQKAQDSYNNLRDQIASLSTVINAAEDDVFRDFCRTINIVNIREYEQSQLKLDQEESEARLRYDNQIARLSHQHDYNAEAMKTETDRLARLDEIIETEEANLAKLESQKDTIQQELSKSESAIGDLREELSGIQETLEERSHEVEQVKRKTAKAFKALEQALKEITSKNDEIEKLSLERSSIYRKCRLEEIDLPLLEGNLRNVPLEENLRDEVAMDVDEDGTQQRQPKRGQDYGIEVDFGQLEDADRDDSAGEKTAEIESSISKLNSDIERMAPNMKAVDRLGDVEAKLIDTEKEADKARKDSKNAREHFSDVKRRRCELFNRAYNHISDCIDQVYKDLTKGKASPLGGVAYLALEDSEEPYNAGIKYHAMPPMKRFRDMEQLSGGEKTVAALALLFAIHSYQPAPFFVLDEVDAALDNTNVAKVANYIRTQASESFQFIVISLKGSLYEKGNSLVGIYRDQDVNSSRTLTLDLTQYDD